MSRTLRQRRQTRRSQRSKSRRSQHRFMGRLFGGTMDDGKDEFAGMVQVGPHEWEYAKPGLKPYKRPEMTNDERNKFRRISSPEYQAERKAAAAERQRVYNAEHPEEAATRKAAAALAAAEEKASDTLSRWQERDRRAALMEEKEFQSKTKLNAAKAKKSSWFSKGPSEEIKELEEEYRLSQEKALEWREHANKLKPEVRSTAANVERLRN